MGLKIDDLEQSNALYLQNNISHELHVHREQFPLRQISISIWLKNA